MASSTTDPNTTFVQADPSTFRTIVQQLTGASDPSSPKLPLTHRVSAASDVIGPKKPVFKLHERRQAMKKIEMIKLNNNNNVKNESPPDSLFFGQRGFLVSPVSTLDFLPLVSPSSRTRSVVDEEEEKGFCLQQSPFRRGAEPELLPLFPLHSPRENIE